MKTTTIYLVLITVLLMAFSACKKENTLPDIPVPEVGKAGDNKLNANLDYVVEKYQIPAISTMTMIDGQILESGQSGVRKMGDSNFVGNNDKWHIGSITKSMTATLTAILIEKGHLNWETKVGEIIQGDYNSVFNEVTLLELLSQTSGVSAQDVSFDLADPRPITEIRKDWSLQALNLPAGTKGQHVYSNNNFVIVGHILETIMDQSWEELMIQHLFDPMEMDDTAFGAPRNTIDGDHPWGHQYSGNSWTAFDAENLNSDNPLALGPAGTVHITTNDMMKYSKLHLGITNLLTAESLTVLHTEVNGSGYALGWNVAESGIFHSGNNNRWFAQLFISLDEGFVNFAVTNSSDNNGLRSQPAVVKTLEIMGTRFLNSH